MADRRPLGKPKEVAEYLGISERTLEDWAYRGRGVPFVRVEQQRRYRWEDVDRYLAERASHGAS